MGSEARGTVRLLLLGIILESLSIISAATYDFENGLGPDWKTDCQTRTGCFKVAKVKDNPSGPSVDHTLGTDQGSCAYATGHGSAVLKATAQGPFCFTGWYHESGVAERSFAHFSCIQDKTAVHFHFTKPARGGRWRQVTYSESRKGVIEIEITAYRTENRQEYAFVVDDLTVDPGHCKQAPQDGSCNFDWGDTCGYNVGNGSQTWNLRDRSTLSKPPFETVPGDATVAGPTGGYAYYMPPQNGSSSGELTSVMLEPSPKERCLEFYYYIPSYISPGNTSFSLSVFNEDVKEVPIWKPYTGDFFLGEWIPVKASYKASSKHKLKFVCAIPGGGHMGFYCAVDGIKLTDCKPQEGPQKRFCNFESDWCDWRNAGENGTTFPWILQGGTVKSTFLRPKKDHTFMNSSGSYLFVSNAGRYLGQKAQLINSVSDYVSMTRCMTFWYIAAAGRNSKLRVVAKFLGKMQSKEITIWEVASGAPDIWKKGRVALSERTRVLIEAVMASSRSVGYMVLDDISIFKDDFCETSPADAHVGNDVSDVLGCTFEEGTLCRWSSATYKSEDRWLFPSVTEPMSKIGPTSIPREAEGSYIFVSKTVLDENGFAKDLKSTWVPRQKAPVCGSFYYHMFSAQGCTLAVNIITQNDGLRTSAPETVFWHFGRSLADRWYHVQRTLTLNADENQVQIKVTREGQGVFELGIGPMQFTPGACEIASDSQGWCDFEYNTCGWTLNGLWRLQKYETHTPEGKIYKSRSGPVNSMHFLEFEASKKPNSSTVISQNLTGSAESQCLEFWYQRNIGSDGAILAELVLDSKTKVLWLQPPNSQDDWMFARIPIQVEKRKTFQVVFRGTTGGARETRLRLDEIALRPGPCSHLVQCQFSDDLCGYVNDYVDEFRWLVGEGRRFDPTPETEIPGFSSDGIKPATVAYVDLTSPASHSNDLTGLKGKDSRELSLMSPIFEVKDADDTITVHYVRDGEDILSMKVRQVAFGDTTGKPTILQENELSAGPKWSKFKMPLKPSKHSQIVITLTRGLGAKGIAAISRIMVHSKQPAEEFPGRHFPFHMEALQCDFENGTSCDWETDGGDIPWKFNDPARGIPPFPRSDRTLQVYRGRFLFVQGNTSDKSVSAILRSPEIPQEWRKVFCVSLWAISTQKLNVDVIGSPGGVLQWGVLQERRHWSQYSYPIRLPQNMPKVALRVPPLGGLVAVDDISVRAGRCPDTGKCTFEMANMCSYDQPTDNVVTWEAGFAFKLNTTDHTMESKFGRVLFLNTTKVDSHHPISRVFFGQHPPTEASCLKFWWKGYGYPSQLSAYRFTQETVLRDPIASLKTTAFPWWSVRAVTVSSKSKWKIVFEVLSPPLMRKQSGVMLDDVEVTDGECPQTNVCTFEEDVCYPWIITTRNSTADFRGLQVQLASQFKPFPKDHTVPTGDGSYLLLRSTGNREDKSSLMIREPGRYRCTSFWYYLSGKSTGCTIQAGLGFLLGTTSGWKRYQFGLAEPNDFGAGIHVFSGEDIESFAAIDDVVVDERPCSALARPAKQYNCGGAKFIPIERVCDFVKDCPSGADERNCGSCKFSNETCGWSLESDRGSSGGLIWRLTTAGEIEGAPKVDYEGYADGSYMLLYGRKMQLHDMEPRAAAHSPIVRNTAATCRITFWYNYANQNNTLNMRLVILNAQYFIPIWSLYALTEEPPERTWMRAVVAVGRYPGELKLAFMGGEMLRSNGYFAIDEIRYDDCSIPQKESKCQGWQHQCSNGACITKTDVCNYVDDCGDLSDEMNCGDYNMGCNFDNSFCEWRPEAAATFEDNTWERISPGVDLHWGPTRDHTSGIHKGKFLFLKASLSHVDALVAGPILKPGKCWISFFFTVVGGPNAELSLNVRTTSNGPLQQVWETTGSGLFHFTEGFTLLNEKQPYQVVFRGTLQAASGRHFGYIAIDDVSFGPNCAPVNVSLPKVPPIPVTSIRPSRCPVGHFACSSNRRCIPPEKVCDFHRDCLDGSDEARCGACDFTTDMCGLTNEHPSFKYAWNWTSASMVASDPVRFVGMPTVDSKDNQEGSYCAHRRVSPGLPDALLNRLLTPELGRVASTCTVSFYAFTGHELTGVLRFGVQWGPLTGPFYNPNRTIFAIVKGSDSNNTWTKVTAKVGSWPRGVRFYFDTNLVEAGLDAISYSHCDPQENNKAWQSSTMVTCNFEKDTNCGWFPEIASNDLNWVRMIGGYIPLVQQPGPLEVKTSAVYMYVENPSSVLRKARMVSKTLHSTPKEGRCLSFLYNMGHTNTGRLNVLVRSETNSTKLVWSRTGIQGKAWRMGRTLIKSDAKHQIILEAYLIGSSRAGIALDNIELLRRSCPSGHMNCDFTAGSCAWRPDNWKITKGDSAVVPETDHTTESGSGGFARLEQTGGRLISLPFNYHTSPTKCLRFWYYLSGSESEQLTVSKVVNSKNETLLWNVSAENVPQKQWLSGSTSVDVATAGVSVAFGGWTSGAPWTAVAVDDIRVDDHPCPNAGSCDFENGDLCTWRNAGKNNTQWYVTYGYTDSRLSGPDGDSKGNTASNYLLLDSQDLLSIPEGILESELLTYSPTSCLGFYHHMPEGSTPKLVSEVISVDGYSTNKHEMSGTTPKGAWTRVVFEMNDLPPVYKLRFTGTLGRPLRGNIALDDITVTPGKCEREGDVTGASTDPSGTATVPSSTTNAATPPTTQSQTKLTKGPIVTPVPPTSTKNPVAQPATQAETKPAPGPSFTPSPSSPTTNLITLPAIQPRIKPSLGPSVTPSPSPTTNPVTPPAIRPQTKPSPGPSLTPSLSSPMTNPVTSPALKPQIKPFPGPSVMPRPPSSTTNPVTPPTIKPQKTPSPGPSLTPSPASPTTNTVTPPAIKLQTKASPAPSKGSSTEVEIVRTTIAPVAPIHTPETLTCRPSEFNCRDNKSCIPLALVCDDVEDCSNGLDEKCGDRNNCPPDTMFCRSGTPDWCLPRTKLCDGNNDCNDGSDESLCGSCPVNYCLNGGTCSYLDGNRSPECQCLPGTSGIRCNIKDIGDSKALLSRPQGASAASVAVPVVLVLVILCAGVAGFVCYRRRKSLEIEPVLLNNVVYEPQYEEARILTEETFS